MLSIRLNSLKFKKSLAQDCKIQVIISNPNQNSVKSVPVEYKKKENIALFCENFFLKDVKKQANKDDLSYLIIEVYEKYPYDKIIASKTFASNDIFSKNQVSLKTVDGNELIIHMQIEDNEENEKNAQLFKRQSSMANCVDDSISMLDGQFGSPFNAKRFDQLTFQTTQSAEKSQKGKGSPPLNPLNSSSSSGKKEIEGGEQLFSSIVSSIKNGFLQLCEKDPETDLDYLDMNEYMYQFVSKLGPVVAISNYLREVYNWTNIFQTLMYGVCFSLVIFYPKTIILLSLLYTYIFTKKVIQILFQLGIQKQEKVNIINKNVNKIKNLKRNMIFLQEQMRFYSGVYDQVSEFLFSDDKTQVLKNIQLFRNYSIFLVLGMVLVPFQLIIFSAFWFTLISQTYYGRMITREGMTIIHKLAVRSNKFIDNEIIVKYFPKSVIEALPIPEKQSGLQKIVKKFIIQENQRWWLGKGWADLLIPGDIPKWSDVQGIKELKKEDFKLPESHWNWEKDGQWQVVKSDETDEDGWQYGKSFNDDTFINYQKSLYYVRKRLWYKTCSCLISYYDGDDEDEYEKIQN